MADNVQQLVDSLGRVVEVSDKVGNALDALATAMTEQVKVMTKFSKDKEASKASPAVDRFVELIEDKDNKLKEFVDYLKDKLPKVVEDLTENIEEVNNKFKETIEVIEELKTKAKTKTETAATATATTDKCDCQSALDKIANNLTTINTTLTNGSGLKLEERLYSALDKIVENTKLTVEAIRKIGGVGVTSGTTVDTTKAASVKPEFSRAGLGSIFNSGYGEIFNKLIDLFNEKSGSGGIFDDMFDKKTEKTLKDVVKLERTLCMQTAKLNEQFEQISANLIENSAAWNSTSSSIDDMERNWNRVSNLLNNFPDDSPITDKRKAKEYAMELTKIAIAFKEGKKSADELVEAQEKAIKNIKSIDWKGRWGDVVASGLMQMVSNYSNKVLGGFISNLTEWEKESTRMAATMTGAIHDAGGEARKLVDEYRNLLSASDELIKQTHQFPAVIRKEWTKAIKKGTRSINETKEAVNSALAAAWQVDATAESVSDEFQKWNMEIGLSKTGSVSLARTMATVAKTTGVMGDNLLQAVASAREIAQQMKDTGLYTQQAADSVVSFMASGQKFGVAKQIKDIFTTSQGGLQAFVDATSEMKNLIAASGQLPNVLAGNADPDKVMAGVDEAIRQAIPAKAFEKDATGKPVGLPDLKKLSNDDIARLDIVMKRRFGMKLGELVRVQESIQDQDPTKKLERIQKDLANPRLTDAEKQSLKLEEEQTKIAKSEKSLNKIMSGLGAMSDEGKKNGATLDSMLQQGKMTEAEFKQGITDSAQLLSQKMERQGKRFEDLQIKDEKGNPLSERGFTDKMNSLSQGMRDGNHDAIKQFRDLQIQMANANKTADSNAKNESNMSDKMETDQQWIQNYLQNMLKPLNEIAMQAGRLIWYSAMIGAGIYTLYRAWSRSRLGENMKLAADTLVQTIGTKGSGWVHDPYVEHFVKNIDKTLVLIAKKQGVVGASTVDALVDKTKTSVDTNDPLNQLKDKLGPLGVVVDKVKEKFGGLSDAAKTYLSSMFDAKAGFKENMTKAFGKVKEDLKTSVANTKDVLAGKKSIKDIMPAAAPAAAGSATTAAGSAATAATTGTAVTAAESKLVENAVAKSPVTAQAENQLSQAQAVTKQESKVANAESALASKEKKTGKLRDKEFAKSLRADKANKAGDLKIPTQSPKDVVGPKAELPKPDVKQGGSILKGAAKVAAIAAAVIALGVILVMATEAIMSYSGFDAKQAKEVATVLGVVVGAGAGVLLAAAAVGFVMEKAEKIFTMKTVGSVYKGGAFLLALLPALIILGGVVLGLGALISYIMPPAKAKEYASAVASILGSVALIALAVLGSALALTVLGLLVPFAKFIVPLMLLGALAFTILTPAMLALATGVLFLSKGMLYILSKMGMTPKDAAEISKAVADIMWSAAKIAGSVLLAAASLTLLGLASPAIIWAIPLMMWGARVLYALTPAMVLLAASIVTLSKGVLKSLTTTPEEAAKVSGAVADIMWSAAKIAGAVLLGAVTLTILGAMAGYAFVIAGLMFLGAAALFILTPAMIKMSSAILNMASQFGTAENAKAASDISKNTAELFESTMKICRAVIDGRDLINSLGSMSILARVFGPSFKKSAKSLKEMSAELFAFSRTILNMAVGMPPSDKVADVSKQLEGLLNVLRMLPTFLNTLAERMEELTNAKFMKSNVGIQSLQFAVWFETVGISLNSIMVQVATLPSVDEINKATYTLNVLVEALSAMSEAMQALSMLIGEISSVGIDFSALENVGGIFKSGEFKLILQAKEYSAASMPIESKTSVVGETDDTQSWMDKLLGIFTGIKSPAVSRNSKFLTGMSQGIGSTVEKPVNSVAQATGKVGSGINRLDGTMNKIQTNQTDMPAKLDIIHTDLQSILMQLRMAQPQTIPLDELKNTTAAINKVSDTIMLIGNIVHADLAFIIAQQIQGIQKSIDDMKAMNLAVTGVAGAAMLDKVLPYLEQMATASSVQEEPAVKTSISQNDFDKQVQSRVEQSRPSDAMTGAMQYLASIEANTKATSESVQEAVEVLEDIKQIMNTPSNLGSGFPNINTKPNVVPRSSPNFYTWQLGRFGDTAAKQYTNPGY